MIGMKEQDCAVMCNLINTPHTRTGRERGRERDWRPVDKHGIGTGMGAGTGRERGRGGSGDGDGAGGGDPYI